MKFLQCPSVEDSVHLDQASPASLAISTAKDEEIRQLSRHLRNTWIVVQEAAIDREIAEERNEALTALVTPNYMLKSTWVTKTVATAKEGERRMQEEREAMALLLHHTQQACRELQEREAQGRQAVLEFQTQAKALSARIQTWVEEGQGVADVVSAQQRPAENLLMPPASTPSNSVPIPERQVTQVSSFSENAPEPCQLNHQEK